MTELYPHEQQQTEHSTTEMPNYYSSTRHRTLITKHVSDDDDQPNSVPNEEFIIQIFQHWKIKTLEHQQALNNSGNNTTSNHFSQTLPKTVLPIKTSSNATIPNETLLNNNKDDISNIIEQEKPITTMQKRVSPVPKSYIRRKDALKKSTSAPNECSNPNLLSPNGKTKLTTTTTVSTTTGRKSPKQGPIFIAPKKTPPSLPPRPSSLCSFDESIQTKRKTTLEKQNSPNDEQSLSPTWAPPPSTRSYVQSSCSAFDDDDQSSSDEIDYGSLLIRNKKSLKKTPKHNIKYFLPIPPNIIIPTAVFIIDPNGHTHRLDFNDDSFEDLVNTPRIVENIYPDTSYDQSPSSIAITPPTSPVNHDQYALHSIGEEEEDVLEKNNNNGVILSKELDRIQAISRPRASTTVQYTDVDQNQDEEFKLPLGRRWSEGAFSDDENHLQPSQSRIVKTPSATSVVKQSIAPPVKLSRTKLFLIKLHLAPSPNKDVDSNTSLPPSKKRTVRRSSDKKRYQTQ
jgi:hypothetical protein